MKNRTIKGKILSLCLAVAMVAGMTVTASAAETGDITTKTGYVIPGVVSVDTVKASADSLMMNSDPTKYWVLTGDFTGAGSLADLKVYNVRVGTKINLGGFTNAAIDNDIKFESDILFYERTDRNADEEITYDGTLVNVSSSVDGRSYTALAEWAHFTFMKEGYYALTAYNRAKDQSAEDGSVIIRVIGANAPTPPSTEGKITATASSSKVLINGTAMEFDAYTINENNYFKLRDIAQVLSGSLTQFEVTWDNTNNAINLLSKKAYTAVGGELVKGDGTAKTAVPSTAAILKDGTAVTLTAYTINENNYFKLRDLGQSFNFDVSWDATNNCVVVDTNSAYTAD